MIPVDVTGMQIMAFRAKDATDGMYSTSQPAAAAAGGRQVDGYTN